MRFSGNLPPSLYGKVKAESEKEERSMNSIIVKAVEQYYERKEEISNGRNI